MIMFHLTKLCKKHQKCKQSRKRQPAPWWTPTLEGQRSWLIVLKRLFHRTTEQVQRGKLNSLFWCKTALYTCAILQVKRTHFWHFILEELNMNRFGAACNVMKGKWKKNVPDRLITSSPEEVMRLESRLNLQSTTSIRPWYFGEFTEQNSWTRLPGVQVSKWLRTESISNAPPTLPHMHPKLLYMQLGPLTL